MKLFLKCSNCNWTQKAENQSKCEKCEAELTEKDELPEKTMLWAINRYFHLRENKWKREY